MQEDPDSLLLDYLSLASVFGGNWASFRHFLDIFRPNYFDLDSNLVFFSTNFGFSLN
jgi:hypothetical protein